MYNLIFFRPFLFMIVSVNGQFETILVRFDQNETNWCDCVLFEDN